jgi:2',3'-cyclic-nucleotide 2'-phosphodiesterase/3'-nucleotidase
VILHTSDLHGHVEAQDEVAERDFGEGLARVATAVRAARAEGTPLLLLDSGDTIQGTPMQALSFEGTIGDGSDPTIRAMNRLGYDAMAVGNHEFDFGLARLEKSRRQARFPWLSANTVRANGKPAFEPYVVREIAGARVGILGLTTKNVAGWEPPSHVAGLTFLDTVETARRFVPILRRKERCDLVIVLTHEGFERDPVSGETRGKEYENHAYAMATQVPGIDLLLTGHTHTVIDPRRLGDTWVSQPGRFGNTVTRFEIDLERRGRRAHVTGIRGVNVSMKAVAPDPEIAESVREEDTAARQALSEVIARLEVPLSNRDARTSDTPVLDWLHAVQIREGRADISFASLLPGSLPAWPAGPLTARQVWAFYPYENALVTVRATGRQLREALEIAGRCVSGLTVEAGKVVWQRSQAVWGYNCDTMEGAEYALDPTRPEGHRLLYLRRNGKPVGDDEVFAVAINSYRAAGGGEYELWKRCPRISTSERSLRDLLLEDARSRRVLRLETDENWMLAPSLPEGRMGGFPQ